MDATISDALEEICSRGEAGVPITALWPALEPSLAAAGLDLSPAFKQALWTALLAVPSLRFRPRAAGDPSAQSVEAAEELGVTITADERLRDSFLGLYNAHSANAAIPVAQRRALQRLAVARKDGITQRQLGKEFGVEGRNLFYVLKGLECQGLIVRQSAVVKTKEAGEEGDSMSSQSVITNTNLVYLSRYAKHLGSQQRFEITKEEKTAESLGNVEGNPVSGESLGGKKIKEDVLVKDYLPAMKAVCDKLEKANGKVLVVSDIKKELGFSGAPKHREWRQVCSRLRDTHTVLEFDAIVNKKVERCLRLLKSFSPSVPKNRGCVDNELSDDQLKFGKKCQLSNQLVELPIEHQIFDIIDASGSEGLTVIEICKRLGIDNKKNHNRLVSMFSRFGMDLQAENHKKCVVYRVWAPGRRNSGSAQSNVPNDDQISEMDFASLDVLDRPSDTCSEFEPSHLKCDIVIHEEMKNKEISPDLTAGSPTDNESNFLSNNSKEILSQSSDMASEGGLDIAFMELGKNNALSEPQSAELKPVSSRSIKKQPFLPLTADGVRREKMILERFQNEKFLVKAELLKWLENQERDKATKIDRKTVDRLLNKLQQEGHCKCIHINIPYITNCGGRRTIQVVLHPSVQSITPELVSEIHDRLRSFEIQSRGHCSSQVKNNDSVPVLKDVQRTKIQTNTDAISLKSEAMRANGFVSAKMIRAKLLHGFLWRHLCGSGGSNGALSSTKCVFELNTTKESSKLFSLEAAIKAIPIELFVQVVGSTQPFDSMIKKCRGGLCLSDLHVQEYKCLMDTHATGRLSLIVEILRKLKLIRIVSGECPKDGSQHLQPTFTHSLELQPYIEEPISKEAVFMSFKRLDLRPRIRHDFVLLSGKAVDEYWQTLEFCYAAADPRAALHAFPGSAVHEVFLSRSWASGRVMTADQRAEFLKHVMKDGQNGKLSFKDCGRIAKELNLSLEQVLRMYYDKCQSRSNKFQGEGNGSRTLRSNCLSSLRKRVRSPEARSEKLRKVDEVTGVLEEQRPATLSDTVDSLMEGEILVPPGKHEMDLQASQEADHVENEVDSEQNEDDDMCYSVISRSALSKLKPARQRRVQWTEEADRQLVIQYARYRAALGAKYHRTDWASISDLPAPPSACKKRMSLLNNNAKFRKAVMRLCNILSERYSTLLEKTQDSLIEKDGCSEHSQETGKADPWDDFNHSNVKVALDEVLLCKWMAKPEASKRVGYTCEKSSDLSIDAKKYGFQESGGMQETSSGNVQNHGGNQEKKASRRSRARRLHKRFIKLLSEEVKVSREVHKSLAISNAVELFKLIFLSTSTASEVPDILAGILRCYSEHDLFAAFNYLREKKFMVGGTGNQPYSLSQQFIQNVSKSPFPANSGARAAKFANLLHERERELIGGLDLGSDLQCGDIFHLFALVSSGQLSLSPSLPDEGVGEAEDTKSLKRKIDSNESEGDKGKKLKSLVAAEGEIISRREKGFPGIMVSINQTGVLTADAVNLFRAENPCTSEQPSAGSNTFETSSGFTNLSNSNIVKEMLNSNNNISVVEDSNESSWIVMASYALCLLPKHADKEVSGPVDPEIFSSVYAAIRKAGDQGLSVEEVSQLINIAGGKMPELIISVLQTFGRVLKVNAFDAVHIVDASYRSKYLLASAADISQHLEAASLAKLMKCNSSHLVSNPEHNDYSGGSYSQGSVSISADAVHKVSVLNFPEEVNESPNQTSSLQEGSVQRELVSPGGDKEDESLFSSELRVPILPWINGDGTINKVIYKALRRRVLGIVMQNPGVLEDHIINQMEVLNPQSCRKLLELMILDKHLYVKKMHQTTSNAPPPILQTLFRSSRLSEPKLVCRDHLFANPLSTSLL